ncbi:uncharacterized protein LOC127079847 [Lathyrus oleraceus]|uniref:uncharacterized protein LOC127079847 n=1 Tax=Pisum sativum TaxID=3888 RepID=UPI0021D2BD37|nr:uncharacterized protein LOC127079847 [Pisum sativum]
MIAVCHPLVSPFGKTDTTSVSLEAISYIRFFQIQIEALSLPYLSNGPRNTRQPHSVQGDKNCLFLKDPGMELAKLCVSENVPVVPIPGPCALVSALSASGLSTYEFTFVGFLQKHSGSRRKRLMASAEQTTTQIFYVPPHKLSQFLEEGSSIFGDTRKCVIAREMTKFHEEFWRGSLGEANHVFFTRLPKGELTILIEGQANSKAEPPPDTELENELRGLIENGEGLSTAVKLVTKRTPTSRKTIYSLALRKIGKQVEVEDDSS